MGAAVDGTVAAVTADTTDANQPGYWLRRYFTGEYPAGRNGVNYLDSANAEALGNLRTGLINFFGVVLGCGEEGNRWNSTGYPFTDLTTAHAGMKIRKRDFDLFNKALLNVVASVAEFPDSAEFAAVATNTSALLNSTESTMVIPSTLSFCDKYSDALGLSNEDLLTAVVSGTVSSVLSDAALRRYFDGSIAGTRNITGSTTLFNGLAGGLVSFFGQTAVLGCTDPAFPAYTGATMKVAHAKLGITRPDFNNFNDRLIAVLNGYGVSAPDQAAVRGVLDSTAGDIITGSPAAATAVSFFVLVAALLAMLF